MRVKKRTIAGGVLAVGILIGAFLSGWNIPGLGTGAPETGSEADDTPDEFALATLDAEVEIIPAPVPVPLTDDVVDVRIEDRSYWVRQLLAGKKVYQPAELDQIVEWAKKAKGDAQGIRVRISRRGSARVSTWETLQHELTQAGLSQSSVLLQEGLVD